MTTQSKTIDDLKSELLTIVDVCEILKLKRGTLYNWISSKKIPVVKMGKSVRFRRSAIEKFLNTIQ